MLYARWQQIAEQHRNEVALHDLALGRSWTFAQLRADAEQKPCPDERVVFPQGMNAAFVFEVLRAWRWQRIVCPLEAGQTSPRLELLPADCSHLKLTSATTGASRLIAFTGEQLAADAENIVKTMGLRPDWPNVGAISLAHSYGFSSLITPLLLHGIPLILPGSSLPESVRQVASVAPALTLPGVPALWRAWHDVQAIPENVRLAISAGAPLSLVLEHGVLHRTGIKIHNFYGASECGGIAYDSTAEPRPDIAWVGAPMQNVELSLNPNGCLDVRSRAVGLTYWPTPDGALGAGCFSTSDLAELPNGLVYLRGRLNELIHVAGRKISPESIEQVLRTHPDVSECLVFGVPIPEADRTEMIVAGVTLRRRIGKDALRKFLLTKLPAWQVPRQWWFLDSLTANHRGKMSRREWQKHYLVQAKSLKTPNA